MFDVGGGELILIVLAVLVLFGPKKIPEIAQMVNKGMRQVKKAQAQFQTQIMDIQKDIKESTKVDLNDFDFNKVYPANNNPEENPHRKPLVEKNFPADDEIKTTP